jgi:hypothetical protein
MGNTSASPLFSGIGIPVFDFESAVMDKARFENRGFAGLSLKDGYHSHFAVVKKNWTLTPNLQSRMEPFSDYLI